MRPETAYRKVSNAIDFYLHEGSYKLSALEDALPAIKSLYRKAMISECDVGRAVECGYGYVSRESINANLFYISDRFNCAWRLKWLIDGLENGQFSHHLGEMQ